MLSNEKIKKVTAALSGLTYTDWIKLRTGIDRAFESKAKELERQLLTPAFNEVAGFIQSQFGEISD